MPMLEYRHTIITFSVENTGVLWQTQCSVKGFCCSKIWFSIFTFLCQVPHQLVTAETQHIPLAPSEEKIYFWHSVVLFSCHGHHFCWLVCTWGMKSSTSFYLPTDLMWKHLNSSPAFCMTSKQKFSVIPKVYNSVNIKGYLQEMVESVITLIPDLLMELQGFLL